MISIEPLVGAATRQLFSFRANSIHRVANDDPLLPNAIPPPRQIEPFATLETAQAITWAARDARMGLGPSGGEASSLLSKRAAKALAAKAKVKAEVGDGIGRGFLSNKLPLPEGDGRTRLATVWLFNNGASDLVEEREMGVYEGNPGASWFIPESEKKSGPRSVLGESRRVRDARCEMRDAPP